MLYHHSEPLNRAKATTTLDMNYRLARTTLITETAQEQFGAVSEIVAGGAEDSQVLCNYGLNILVEAATEEELDKRISQITTISAQYELTPVRDGSVSQAVWWSMFPTYDTSPRPWQPMAAIVATFLALQ